MFIWPNLSTPRNWYWRIEKLIEIRRLLQSRYQGGLPLVKDDAYRQEDEFIINLKTYILKHIDASNLSGDHIGKHFAMSRVHLYRKLKALTNQSISEFVKFGTPRKSRSPDSGR